MFTICFFSFLFIALPYALAPAAAYEHILSHYISYLASKSIEDPETHYIDGFETISSADQADDDSGEDDEWNSPPDDNLMITTEDYQYFAEQYAEYYIAYSKLEHQHEKSNRHILNVKESTIEVM